MKKKIQKIAPSLKGLSNYGDFAAMFKSSQLEVGLDDTPLTNDNIVEISREFWMDTMNQSPSDNALATFQEYMKLLKQGNQGFEYLLVQDSSGKCTGCLWQTAIMRDNFDRFVGFISIDVMKRGLNTFLWP